MKFRAWLGSSFVLICALAGTIALFHYWDTLRSQSLKMLQNRLNEMELQRFEEDKGSQVLSAAAETETRFSQALAQQQSKIEALADTAPLRRAARKDSEWAVKKQELNKAQKLWAGYLLTDETGAVRAQGGKKKPPANISSSPAFAEARKLRRTALRMLEQPGAEPLLQITSPCLSDRGAFLGVLQVEIPIGAEFLQQATPKGGFQTMLATSAGKRLTPVRKERFPQNLGALLSGDPKQASALLAATVSRASKAKWEATSYIMASAKTPIPQLRVFTLLEVSSLERVVGPSTAEAGLLSDPVVLAGVAAIACTGLILMFFFSGGSMGVIKKVNRQLLGMLQTGDKLQYVEAPSGGEWEKLTDLINQMIERVQTRPQTETGAPENREAVEAAARTAEALAHVRSELDELHHTYDQTLVLNQQLNQELDSLRYHNQQLEASLEEAKNKPPLPAASPPAPPPPVEELLATVKEEGRLRIEAIFSMSEDLKATLMVIKNYISSILSSEEGKITDTQQEFLGVVINKSARLERQINDLLDISHMESGVTQLYPSRTDLVSMIQDVVLNSQPQADTKQVKLLQEMQMALPLVMLDSDRMGQVFIHLVQHAIKISPVGGEVHIIGMETMTDIVIKIRDSGTPLTPEQTAKVFIEFHGGDSNAGPDVAGTGLRFAIIRRIVEAHHGSVTMRGLPDKGNETVVSFVKTAEFLAPQPKEETASLERYEIKPASERTESAAEKEGISPYDLTGFMGKMDELEEKETPSTRKAEGEASRFPGGEEDLNKLLSDIENMEDRMD
ncbi:sensor histidine kinase [candidate division FCPU426 bacterium]|nr:sensor histidine kinase [candidate division FCPU426 bacterium]